MRILITGGYGLIGGRVAQYLQRFGYQVILGSRHARPSAPNWLPGAEAVTTTWDNHSELSKVCHNVDVVLHAAGMNAQDCAADPVGALEFNGLGTARLFQAALESKTVKRFIFLSTAHVYAAPLVGEITEERYPRNIHPYATSNLAGENSMFGLYGKGQTMDAFILRVSNAFGAPMDKAVNCWGLLANDLCRQAVARRQLVLKSMGHQQRNFIPIEAFCEVIRRVLGLPFQSSGIEMMNVGSNGATTVAAMAEMIQTRCLEVLNYHPPIVIPDNDTENREPLDYRIGKQLSIIGEVECDFEREIDQLLLFCKRVFG